MKYVLLSAALLLAAPAAHAQVAESDVVRCAAVVADAERLACYDAIADRVSAAASVAAARREAAVAAAAKAEAEAAAVAAKAAEEAAARKRDSFGAETTPQRDALADDKLSELTAKVADVYTDRYGMYLLMLDNGQQWKQVDGKLLIPREGDDVTVKRAALGSYTLKIERQGRTVKVRRIR